MSALATGREAPETGRLDGILGRALPLLGRLSARDGGTVTAHHMWYGRGLWAIPLSFRRLPPDLSPTAPWCIFPALSLAIEPSGCPTGVLQKEPNA